MTREEAYNRIDAIIAKHEIDDDYVTITSLLDYDALRMARKVLEQEPKPETEDSSTESSTDCISRESVLEILGNYGCTNKEGLLFRDIKELPSVKPNFDFEEVAEDIDMMEEDIDLACDSIGEIL